MTGGGGEGAWAHFPDSACLIRYLTHNPLHFNIKMQIIHTILHAYPKVSTGRIRLTKLVIISTLLMPLICDSGVIL